MTRIASDWLHAPETVSVMAVLQDHSPHFVGGCVRDALLGRVSEDVDIAVSCPPGVTMKLASAAGLTSHPTGIEHGVVTVVSGKRAFEVATFRRDVATDGRRAVVAYSTDIAEDAARRDFTMNALFATADGTVVDPLGSGLNDLREKRIRYIGDPVMRIREDYLRILRFFRFHAQLGVTEFELVSLNASLAEAEGLNRISGERIGAEMLKLLSAVDPVPALQAMDHILQKILHDPKSVKGLPEEEMRAGVPPQPIRRLAMMNVLPEHALTRLRLSKADASQLEALHRAIADDAAPKVAGYRYGEAVAQDAALIRAARGQVLPPDWQSDIKTGAALTLPITAKDLISAGAEPGQQLGRHLRRIESEWVASDFRLSRPDLMAFWKASR